MSEGLRHLDMFAGVGSFSLGLEASGLTHTTRFIEIDPFCQRVLKKHWPDIPIHGDVTTYEFTEGEADVITGGFPCQDVSCAGKRAGLTGARSGLYRELVRAIRVVRPLVAILENVAALLSDGMGTVLGDLAEIGDCIEWDCVSAATCGASHKRDRVWIIAHADGEWRSQSAVSWKEKRLRIGHGSKERPASSNASDAPREQVGSAGQSRIDGSVEPSSADAAIIGCGQRREGRPPDSFARIRDEARRNAADPYGARLAFREGLGRDSWEKLSAAERDAFQNGRQSIWPDEPALSGVDDDAPYWLDRVRATGNGLIRIIPELIGRAISDARKTEGGDCG